MNICVLGIFLITEENEGIVTGVSDGLEGNPVLFVLCAGAFISKSHMYILFFFYLFIYFFNFASPCCIAQVLIIK